MTSTEGTRYAHRTNVPGTLHRAPRALAVSGLLCPVCFGTSDAPMAQAMNWGVLTLLAITLAVLVSFGLFFLRLRQTARLKSSATSPRARCVASGGGPNFSSADSPN